MKRPLPEPPPEPRLDDAGGPPLLRASFSRAVLARAAYVSPTRPFFCRSNSGERLTDGLCPISATSAMSADALAAASPCLTAATRLALCASRPSPAQLPAYARLCMCARAHWYVRVRACVRAFALSTHVYTHVSGHQSRPARTHSCWTIWAGQPAGQQTTPADLQSDTTDQPSGPVALD